MSHNGGMLTATDLVRGLRAIGLSQSEIARRTHIPQSRLSRWEAGATPTGADDALRLHALHRELIGTDGAPGVPTAPEVGGAEVANVA